MRGRRITATEASGHATTRNYSTVHGNSYYLRDPRGNESLIYFDALGRADTAVAPNGTKTGTGYGVLNQVLETRNQLGHLTTTQYNPDLTIKRIVDPKGQVYKFSYNQPGWITARHLADSTKADSTWYDRAGQPRRTKTRNSGSSADTYELTCGETGPVTCGSIELNGVPVEMLHLNAGQSRTHRIRPDLHRGD